MRTGSRSKQFRFLPTAILLFAGLGICASSTLADFDEGLALPDPAEIASAECPVFHLQSHPAYKLTDSIAQQNLESFRKDACKKVRQEEYTLQWANKVMHVYVVRFALCRGLDQPHLSANFDQALKGMDPPKPVVSMFKKFCLDTASTEKKGYIPRLEERLDWLKVEWFCQMSRSIVAPGGLAGVIRPELPSFERLEEKAYSLCEALREGEITVEEAWYRFDQEILWVGEHWVSEATRKGFDDMWNLLKNLKDFIE